MGAGGLGAARGACPLRRFRLGSADTYREYLGGPQHHGLRLATIWKGDMPQPQAMVVQTHQLPDVVAAMARAGHDTQLVALDAQRGHGETCPGQEDLMQNGSGEAAGMHGPHRRAICCERYLPPPPRRLPSTHRSELCHAAVLAKAVPGMALAADTQTEANLEGSALSTIPPRAVAPPTRTTGGGGARRTSSNFEGGWDHGWG